MAMHPDDLAALIDAVAGTQRSATRRVVSRRVKRALKGDGGR